MRIHRERSERIRMRMVIQMKRRMRRNRRIVEERSERARGIEDIDMNLSME